ncbi:MAG: DUF427 domain-containing protein [Pseudomonadota bacterium]
MLTQEQTIARPDAPKHYMVLRPVTRRIVVRRGDIVLADTMGAVRLMEHGRSLYDPVIYIPKRAVSDALNPIEDNTTHCPLKGDATYFSLDGSDDAIAWAYSAPVEFAAVLQGYVAFYPDKVTVEEHGG